LVTGGANHDIVIPETERSAGYPGPIGLIVVKHGPVLMSTRSAPLKLFCIPAWIPGLRFAPPGMTKRRGVAANRKRCLIPETQLPRASADD
jgi:hypothetical protein